MSKQSASSAQERILIIKLSALGDFVQALGPFQAIRKHHPDAHITLVTTKPYKELAEKSGWFDRVVPDGKAQLREIKRIWRLRKFLINGRFDMVYDLQTSDRSSLYYHLMWPHKPQWSGIAKGCSHPHANPRRDFMHTIERQREQLEMAEITDVPPPDLAWMDADISHLQLDDTFALLIPGGAPHRPDKRWPGDHYGTIAKRLTAAGIQPVILGTASEADEAAEILATCPEAKSLIGKTSLFEIAVLARRAALALGNDTGPMHMAAAAGCPSLALYSKASDPALCGQRGPNVVIERTDTLDQLPPDRVWSLLTAFLEKEASAS
ncbi:glycosyltransferase family 9 protein [Aestuariispira insulae]|uniref:ADP-heptose:LPS heptosyltransferase n=1 Tax=Aestuariispira insulae TaxID=1461337 RepID=A0A3D9HPL9_9PROT|nr:glycosyltransferase family 9 protein [Aestuariispira insulae]RED51420.1 ADP-heptose:LPS heptosyltransferase [Aestuariispira insulae]